MMDQNHLAEIDSLTEQSFLECYIDLAHAQKLAEDCLARAEQSDYRSGIINARIVLTCLEIYRGHMDSARDMMGWIEEDLVSQASPDDCLMRYSQIRAVYFLRVRNYRDSFDLFVRTGVMAARLGNSLYQCLSENGKGCIKLDQLEFEEAYTYFQAAETFLHFDGNEVLFAQISLNRGCALRCLNKYMQAEQILLQVLGISREKNWKILECSTLEEMGLIMLDQNNRKQARQYIEEGLTKSGDLKDSENHMNLIYLKARLLFQEGDSGQAEELLNVYAAEYRKELHTSSYHQLLAEIQEERGEYKEALANYKVLGNIQKNIRGNELSCSILKQEKKILQEANHQLRMISTIGQELVANLDIGKILNLIYAQMNGIMPVELLVVALVENSYINTKFALQNGKRLKPARIHKENTKSLLAWAVRNRKEIFIGDGMNEFSDYVSDIMKFEDESPDELYNSVICIPLYYIDEVVGVISVQSLQKNAYTNRDLENLRSLGVYAGIALRNAVQTEKMSLLNENLKRQSATDSLTGLVNRREMVHQAKSIWRVCRRSRIWVSLIMIDLDHFKKVNDIHGHAAGDEVLKKCGILLNNYFKRALDCACRYGGEELLVIAGDTTPKEAAARIELIREELNTTNFSGKDGALYKIRFSCGIFGEIPVENINKRLAQITEVVDAYLYEAKNNGRDCTWLSDDIKKPAEKFILRSNHA